MAARILGLGLGSQVLGLGLQALTKTELFSRDDAHRRCGSGDVFFLERTENYRDLIAWQKAKALVLETYRCTAGFPRAEVYGLTSEMRRAAVSVPSNIAEGKGRHSQRELVHFLYHARGSLLELKTQFEIGHDFRYLDSATFKCIDTKSDELGRILNALINRFVGTPPSDVRPKTQHPRPDFSLLPILPLE